MKHWIISVVLVFMVFGCKKDKPPLLPAKAILVFPLKDEACNTGVSISATESAVTLRWNAAANTDSYELNIKNLESGVKTLHQTTQTQLELPLLKNAPYSWYIVSKSSKVPDIAESAVWKFYNSGPGVTTYAPFPAEIIAPAYGQNIAAVAGKITLSWKGSDVDGDLDRYDIYLGTSGTPTLLQKGVTATTLSDIAVASNTTYYWKIITIDKKGFTSDSGVYQFKVN